MSPNSARRTGLSLVLAQVVGQACLLLAVPVYSRLVSVPEVGVFQVATAVAALLQPLATLRLEFTIPASRSPRTARNRARLGYTSAAVTALVLGAISVVCHVLTVGDAGDTALAAAVLVLASGWTIVDNAILMRRSAFRALAVRNVSAGFLAAVLQLAASFLLPGSLSLALAVLVGRGVAIVCTRPPHASDVGGVDEERLTDGEQVFAWRGSALSIGAGLVTGGAMQSLLLVTGALFGQVGAAQLGMAQRVTATPTSLVAQAMSQLVAGRAAEIVRTERPELAAFTRRWTGRLLVSAVLLGAGIAVAGPLLAVPVLGPRWASAGVLVAVLAAPLCLVFVTTPLMPLLIMVRREGTLLALNAFRLTLILITTVVTGLVTRDLLITASATAVVWTLSYATSLLTLLREARRWDRSHPASSGS